MIQRLRKMLDRAVVKDSLSFFGVERRRAGRGIRHEDGRTVSVDEVMASFGVDRDTAEKICKRRSA